MNKNTISRGVIVTHFVFVQLSLTSYQICSIHYLVTILKYSLFFRHLFNLFGVIIFTLINIVEDN